MVSNLTKLYNTLMLIETKGENTKLMGQCLQYLEQMISEEQFKQAEAAKAEQTSETA